MENQIVVRLMAFFLMLSLSIIECQAQTYYAGLGGTYNIVDGNYGDVADKAGFYLSAGFNNELNGLVGYLGEVQFMNQNAKPLHINSGSATFMFTFGGKLKAAAGFQLNMVLSENIEKETSEGIKGHTMAGVAQITYSISDNFSIQARYTDFIGGPLDKVAQFGFNYHFIKD